MFLVINKLNLINILFFVFLNIFKIKICFIEISSFLRFRIVFFLLKKINFIWLNYDFHGEKLTPKIEFKTTKDNLKIAKKIADKFWMDETKFFLQDKNYFVLSIGERIYDRVKFYNKIFYSAKKLKKTGNEKIYFCMKKNEINEEMIRGYKNYYILSFNFQSYFKKKKFKKILKEKDFFIKSAIKNIFRRIKTNKKFDGIDTSFFPHKGIIEHNNIKDYFFTKKNSIISKSIKIIEFNKKDLSKENLNFYNSKKIKLIYWNELSIFLKFNFFLSIIYLCLVCLYLFKAFYKINSRIKFLIIRSIIGLEINKIKLHQFKNLRKMLIGYDFLFPINLAIACKQRKISLISCQRRYNLVFQKQYLLDKYFVMGPIIKKYLENNNLIKISQIVKLGGIINRFKKTKKKYPNKSRKKFKYSCLVLDTKSKLNWYENKIGHGHNWKMNRHFLNMILEIAKTHKDILFILKSKDYNWAKLQVFQKDLKKLDNLQNVELFDQNLKWGNHKIIDVFDFAIGKYTSIVDDFLIRNKPVILYENPMTIEIFTNYGSKVFAYSVNDVKMKIKSLKKNYYNYNKRLNIIRKKLYYKFDNRKFII